MKDIKLYYPLKFIKITQQFGLNYVDFYSNMGMKGHNGIDFMAYRGAEVYAAHSGTVEFSGKDGDGGISVTIKSDDGTFKTIYYHLLSTKVKKGQVVVAGQLIGLADNTGKYTTGDHLHFGLKFYINGVIQDYNNGYKGAQNPTQYFINAYGSGWADSPAYKRYGRKQNLVKEFETRFKNVWLHKELKKYGKLNYVYNTEFINKLVYGGWAFNEALNESLNDIANYVKKDDYKKGIIPFK